MFGTFRNSLNICQKLNAKLYAVKTICGLSEEEWNCMNKHHMSQINDEKVRNCMYEFSSDAALLLENIDKDVSLLQNVSELSEDKITKFVDFDELWQTHLCVKRENMESLTLPLDKVLETTLRWYTILSDKEDSGSTSSYSDYSGSDTDTTDDEEHDDSVSD